MDVALHRLAVFTADLCCITGKSQRSCQRYMQQIRDMFNLGKQQPVTVYHIAEYMSMPVPKIAAFLNISRKNRQYS